MVLTQDDGEETGISKQKRDVRLIGTKKDRKTDRMAQANRAAAI